MNSNDQVALLNDIITKSYDAEKGYLEASEKVSNPRLKNIFNELSTQRYDFGHQIKAEIKKLGGEVDKGDSIAAQAHRVWIDIKTAFASNEDKAVLEEIIRGESYTIDAYKDTLERLPIDSPAYAVLVNQRNSIRSSITRMKGLEAIVQA